MSKILLLLLSSVISLSSCKVGKDSMEMVSTEKDGPKITQYYTCSMHPQVKGDKPGKCPICHMNLTLVELEKGHNQDHGEIEEEKAVTWRCKHFPDVISEVEEICPIDGTPMIKVSNSPSASEIVAQVKLRKSQLNHFRPDYFPTTKMKMRKKIRLLGSVLQSEEKARAVSARIGGRVEKVFVKSTGSLIRKDDPVVEIYSPSLITAGEEYLLARKSFIKTKSEKFKRLLKQSEERLKLWGIKEEQFRVWFSKGKVPRSIKVYSQETGIVQKRNAIVGKYFKEGQNFFELSDLSEVWVEMDVYEQDASLIRMGQMVDMEFTSIPGEIVSGNIDFINPVLNPKSRTLKIRATVNNKNGKLRPGMVAESTLEVQLDGLPLVIPRKAVIDTGKRKVVWVKVAGRQFQAKTVLTGYESEGYVEVKEGLMENEEVVIEGNFLLDAQAQLFGGYENIKR